ncbi:MAG: SBBP repeat-containing protein [Ignavibacteria bacterium]|nr:SBBP repeat-containing protein [Ignavibacteria bacterium]
MKKVLTVLSFLFILNKADSQVTEEWVSRYNGPPGNNNDYGYSVAADGSGNVYVTGSSKGSATGDDYSTVKYNSAGAQQWVRRYNGPGNSEDLAYRIKVDVSGNVYVTGASTGSGTGHDYATIKYNSSGDSIWVRRYNGSGNSGDDAYALAVDISGNVYVAGYSTGINGDYVTIKYNSSGDSLWVRRANWGVNDVATSISVDGSGNVYVTGLSYRFSGYAYLTIKYNSAGVEKWVREYDGIGYDVSHKIAVDGSGNVYVTGYSAGSGTDDYLTIKYDSSGTEKWQRRYNGPGNSNDTAYSLALDVSGNIYVTGASTGSGTGTDYATIKYNSSGDSLWVRRYNGPGNGSDVPRFAEVDGSGNVYLTGTSAGSGTGNDYATIKYNSSGVQQWVKRYNGPISGFDYAYSLALDVSGNVYVTGVSAGNGTGNDYATIKYSQTGSLLTLNLTAFIQGFYNSVSNNMTGDTVRVYLKNNSSPYNTVDSSKGVMSSSGTGVFLFSNAVNGVNYFISVKHRNSIETWSSSSIGFSSGTATFNFATVVTQAYGNNMIQVDLSPLRHAFYSGDNNQDGFVNLTDVIDVYNAAGNFVTGYKSSDMSGDNLTDLTDVLITNNNSVLFVSRKRP